MIAKTRRTKPKTFHGERFRPDDSWSLEDLESEITHEHEAVLMHERKLATHTYRLGRALALARKKVKHGEWASFLKSLNVSTATDCRARQLFERASSESEIEGLTIQQAYERFDIPTGKEKQEKPDRSSDTSANRDRNSKNGETKAALPAPPKEDPDSFGMRLAQMVSRAEWLAENLQDNEPDDEDRKHWLEMARQAAKQIANVIEGLDVE